MPMVAKSLRVWTLLLALTSMPAFGFGLADIIGGVKKLIGDATSGQATKIEQLTQIKMQTEQLNQLKEQLEQTIRHGERYAGGDAWKAGLDIRRLKDMVKGQLRESMDAVNERYTATAQLEQMLRAAPALSPKMTAAEQAEYRRIQDLASRRAVRQSLVSSMQVTESIYRQLDDAVDRLDDVSDDLSQADSQLEALQLIGASASQTNKYLHALTQTLAAQTDLLSNVYAKELAALDRELGGEASTQPPLKLVSKDEAEQLRSEGVRVEAVPERIGKLIKR